MDSKKVILWPVIISIIGHAAMISISSMIDLRENVKAAEIFSVVIKEQEPDRSPEKEEEKEEVKKSTDSKAIKEAKDNSHNDTSEDTVNLGSTDIKYASYLAKIKKRILQIWQYPQKAYEKNEEGVVVLKMSIDAGGNLSKINLLSSSGSPLLDESALGVIRRAAPFERLPGIYNLSRLHIVASFRYKLEE
jgi:periplasmic protein TonB